MSPHRTSASNGYVYIIADKGNSVIVIETTTNLKSRMKRYHQITDHLKLIYYEVFPKRSEALRRDRQLRHLKEKDKFDLIKQHNPEWKDLTEEL